MGHRSIFILKLLWRRFTRRVGWNKDLEELEYWYESVYHPKIAVTRSGANSVTIQEGNGTRSYNMDCRIIRSVEGEGPSWTEITTGRYSMEPPGRVMRAVNEAVALQLYTVQRQIEREVERQMGHQVPSLEDIHEEMRRQGVDPEKCIGVRTRMKRGLISIKELRRIRMKEMETPWERLG